MNPPLFKHADTHDTRPFFVAGPCVIESEKLCLETAESLRTLADSHEVDIVFKASYDKANRTSGGSFRGIGVDEGLKVLRKVREETGLPVLTDVHTPESVGRAADIVDVLQIPAFLCRQTDLLEAAGRAGKTVNIKKGQFMAPADMRFAVEKTGGNCWLTERGTFFGYNRLVVDFASAPELKSIGCPTVFDATHSVQRPGGGDGCSSGNRDLAVPLAKAALAMGFDGLFFEVHPDPDHALCDGPNSIAVGTLIEQFPRLIELSAMLRS